MRILSLLPSATEIVYLLGLEDSLVGISHECDYPPQVRTKPVISASSLSSSFRSNEVHDAVKRHSHSSHSLYRIDEKLLRELHPDLILTQELCNVCAISAGQVREAARILTGPCRIVSLEPHNLRQILDTILIVGEETARKDKAAAVVLDLERRVGRIRSATCSVRTRPKVFCMEWMDPIMAGGHWVPEMVQLAGGQDNLGQARELSLAIDWDHVVQYQPEVLVMMPCGYKIRRTLSEVDRLASKPGWFDLPAVRAGRVYIVDSPAYFSRPGPRIVTGLEILAQILHPELFHGLTPPESAVKLDWNGVSPQGSAAMPSRFLPVT
ncbi:MAG TPA: cobalamin-binding protein [Terriglobia bacterium]|nr:cobalamin-binding protein [Terriglobia bacterium]